MGKYSSTLSSFKEDYQTHGGNPDNIRSVCCDMPPAFISGIKTEFPSASITSDKFNIIKIVTEGIDAVRREEVAMNQYLKLWHFWATHSRLQPMIGVAKTIERHWNGILNYFDSRITNGILERINSVVQLLKRSARGYWNIRNFVTMIYLRLGHPDFQLPT